MSNNPKDALGIKKAPLHLVSPSGLAHESMAMADGASKYGPYNWRSNSVKASIYIAACMRHLIAWQDGEVYAEDSGVHHLAHAKACLGILLDALENDCLDDDRPVAGNLPSVLKRFQEKLEEEEGDDEGDATPEMGLREPDGLGSFRYWSDWNPWLPGWGHEGMPSHLQGSMRDVAVKLRNGQTSVGPAYWFDWDRAAVVREDDIVAYATRTEASRALAGSTWDEDKWTYWMYWNPPYNQPSYGLPDGVNPSDTVRVKLRSGGVIYDRADLLAWGRSGTSNLGDIVWYAIKRPKKV